MAQSPSLIMTQSHSLMTQTQRYMTLIKTMIKMELNTRVAREALRTLTNTRVDRSNETRESL